MSRITIGVVAVLAFAMAGTEAATIAYYRFEDSPGFLQDSGPNGYHLENPAGWGQTNTPFPNPVPQTGALNAKAADVPGGTGAPLQYTAAAGTQLVTGSFTAEAFITRDLSAGWYMNYIVGSADRAFNGFTFMVRTDGAGGQPNPSVRLTVVDTDGVGHNFFPNTDDWLLTLGHDYYVAAVFEDSGASETVTFYQKDLTLGTALMTDAGGPDEGGSNFTMAGRNYITVGSRPDGDQTCVLDGRIDEVRISSGALSEGELLITAGSFTTTTVVPGSTTTAGPSTTTVAATTTTTTTSAGAQPTTIAYYRFEDSPGFLLDSGPNGYDLVNAAGWGQQTNTPFPNPVPQTGAANAKAADLPGGSATPLLYTAAFGTELVTGDFTVEAFITRDVQAGWYMNVIACSSSTVDWPSGDGGFLFSVRTDMAAGQPDESLRLSIIKGGATWPWHNFYPSDAAWTMTFGHDYYVAAVFEDHGATETVTFYQKNLTLDTPLMTGTFGPDTGGNFTMTGANQIGIGARPRTGGDQTTVLDGRIDEVRISSGALSESELLTTPRPSASGTLVVIR